MFHDPNATHTVHNQASLVTALGHRIDDFSLRLVVSDAARERLSARPEMQQLAPSSYIVIQPTASFPSKQWPAEHFLDVARALKEAWDHEVVFTLPGARRLGRQKSREERRADSESLVLSYLEDLYAPEFPVLFDMPLDELMALLDGAALYVGNDSGPMHLATAFGKPVVGIFGSSDPKRWHPWGVPHRVIWAGLECSPCHGKSCANRDRFACVKAIEVKEVIKASLDLLQEKG
jgi:ADP-heptose:LPS heptosyltransferase